MGVRRADRAARACARSRDFTLERAAERTEAVYRRRSRGGDCSTAIARSALSTNAPPRSQFPAVRGGIARMMGEVAFAIRPGPDDFHWHMAGLEASDATVPQTIDGWAVGAKAADPERWASGPGAPGPRRRTRPGFVWCDEVKPAGYRRLAARSGGLPFGVMRWGRFLLLDAKIRRSAFKRWTARRHARGCSVVVANSRGRRTWCVGA